VKIDQQWLRVEDFIAFTKTLDVTKEKERLAKEMLDYVEQTMFVYPDKKEDPLYKEKEIIAIQLAEQIQIQLINTFGFTEHRASGTLKHKRIVEDLIDTPELGLKTPFDLAFELLIEMNDIETLETYLYQTLK
jgi:hypothetical protein